MRNFKIKDFEGCGHYIVRNDKEPNKYTDSGFLTTIMYKIGYIHSNPELPIEEYKKNSSNQYCIVSMSDGWTQLGYFITKDKDGNKLEDTSKWVWVPFRGIDSNEAKQKLVDYLNNPELSQEYRFATQEEVIRVVLYQNFRYRG